MMRVQVSINSVNVEYIDIQRRETFEGPKVYTYDVNYHRQQEHSTGVIKDTTKVITHNFKDGSLVLVRKAIDAVLRQGEM